MYLDMDTAFNDTLFMHDVTITFQIPLLLGF